jgi:hypothetical protein
MITKPGWRYTSTVWLAEDLLLPFTRAWVSFFTDDIRD